MCYPTTYCDMIHSSLYYLHVSNLQIIGSLRVGIWSVLFSAVIWEPCGAPPVAY